MLHRIYNDRVDSLAKEGAAEHPVTAALVEGARRRERVAIIIQHMMVRILQEREPLLKDYIKKQAEREPLDPSKLPTRPAVPTARGWLTGLTPAATAADEDEEEPWVAWQEEEEGGKEAK